MGFFYGPLALDLWACPEFSALLSQLFALTATPFVLANGETAGFLVRPLRGSFVAVLLRSLPDIAICGAGEICS
jgi:hypothetical protein